MNRQSQTSDMAQAVGKYGDFADSVGARVPQLPRTRAAADEVLALAAIDSTMNLSRRMIRDSSLPLVDSEGRARMAAVCAEAQTAGHGRLGRQWVDEPGGSFLVTFITALPKSLVVDSQFNGWFTIQAGMATVEAVADAMRECGAGLIDPDGRMMLKWPNDIFCNGRKLGGILTELVELPGGAQSDDSAVCDCNRLAGDVPAVGVMFGIGLNLDIEEERLPTPISTSLQLVYGPLPDPRRLRDAIAAGIADRLRARLAGFVAEPVGVRARLLDEMRSLCWTLGRQVEARFTDGSVLRGQVVGLNADASLTVRDDAGALHDVQTADVGVLA